MSPLAVLFRPLSLSLHTPWSGRGGGFKRILRVSSPLASVRRESCIWEAWTAHWEGERVDKGQWRRATRFSGYLGVTPRVPSATEDRATKTKPDAGCGQWARAGESASWRGGR